MIKRQRITLQKGNVRDTIEYHDGKYGAPGESRQTKRKITKEDIRKVNALNKARRVRLRLLEYFNSGDCFATWTYDVKNRPPNMEEALKDFQKAMKYVRKQYKRRGKTLYWFRNIEQGTKGAWHIHLIMNEIGDTPTILRDAWEKGGTYTTKIKLNAKIYDEDFTKLSAYITKDQYTEYTKEDGTKGKPRIRQANYNASRNMPVKLPDTDKLKRWKKEIKPSKGFYIVRVHEGINPKTGFKYRRYTEIRLNRRI